MNLFYLYMQGACQAAIDAGEPLIDESLYLIMDSGMLFMIHYPNATLDEAQAAGRLRVTDPTNIFHRTYPE